MPKKNIIPTPVKEAIARAKNNNLETKEVAKIFNVSERSVRNIFKRFKEDKGLHRRPKTGRPRKINDPQNR
jgi:transposase